MGRIEPGGDASFNVLIRTLEGRHGNSRAQLGLGSGLVVDSVAAKEWAECLLKGEFVTRQSRPFDLIETMRFDPSDGIIELDRHLDRMAGSAEALDFAFDRHAARNELQAATFGRKATAMIRLLLGQSGAMAIELTPIERDPPGPVTARLLPLPVAVDDFRLRHKTTDRAFYDSARRAAGTWDVVFHDPEGRITEGSRTSVFVERDGVLVTPPESLGMIPGVLRARLLDEGKAIEGELTRDDLEGGFFLGNSARGLIPAMLG
jgi:para-aminobenzoate synthetase/4-amino-4-deoxychorismate lyase